MSVEAVRKAFGTPESLAPVSRKIDFSNGNAITVGADLTAIPLSSTAESIAVINTGDLTGGIGIDVYTGAIDLDTALVNDTQSVVFDAGFVPLYDDVGSPHRRRLRLSGLHTDRQVHLQLQQCDPATRSGRVDHRDRQRRRDRLCRPARDSGAQPGGPVDRHRQHRRHHRRPRTPSSAPASTPGPTSTNRRTPPQTAVGERTYNAYGQVTGVVSLDEYTVEVNTPGHGVRRRRHRHQQLRQHRHGRRRGAARLRRAQRTGRRSASRPVGDGGTTIVNSGDIKVDQWSAGIHVASTATTSVSNSGRIDIGNYSTGISFGTSAGHGPATTASAATSTSSTAAKSTAA